MRGAQLANGLLCWLLMLCFANGIAKGTAKGIAWCCFAKGIANALLWLLASGSGFLLYKLVCLKFNSLSKYHAEPPTLTRLGASADFLSIELK